MKLAINGFGRIGRNVCKVALATPGVSVVAINDLTDPKTLAHLFKYDSVHGRFQGTVSHTNSAIMIDGVSIPVYAERNPANLPWSNHDVDVAIESTGIFTQGTSDRGGYLDHIQAGAKKVILTVPAKDSIQTIVLGVNDAEIKSDIVAYSNASCTTNCLAPLAKVIHHAFGIEKGFMNTVHAYTNDQKILDLPHSDLRRARAASESIIPTTTGAAKAVGLVIPDLAGKLDGGAMRVPVKDGSVIDLTLVLNQAPSRETIMSTLEAAAAGDLAGIMEYTEEPIVSCDVIGNPHSSIIDGLSTMVMGNLVKLVTWYDNEWGYSNRVVDLAKSITGA
ncbi:MAG: type I glyceraldehyde-3-phosphate dehydrogenase [bacterium]|nr:type I glyceraldehyde-3-phosphate dehydrogenase [bacterium]